MPAWFRQSCYRGRRWALPARGAAGNLLLAGLAACLVASGLNSDFLAAAEPAPLLALSEPWVTFVLEDAEGRVPQLVLFDAPHERDTAESINFWRGTPGIVETGVAVQFKGLRFLRDPASPDALIVRLVGIKNELELTARLSLEDLQNGKEQRLHFGPAAIGVGIVTGTTDAEMLLAYNAAARTLEIAEVSGQFEWKRLFHDPQSDSGALTNVSGKVGQVPAGGTILKATKP